MSAWGAQPPRFGLAKSLIFSALLIALTLGVAELIVRGWAYYLREDAERWDAATGTFVLVPGEHRSRVATARINSDGFVGPELQPDGPDLWRIVALGDSCTYGEGDDVNTYPAMLSALLAGRDLPDRRYEVVNAGISGMNSELALRRLRTKVIPLDPDVVTVYVGWNDLMKFDPAGQGGDLRWAGLARVLDRLWLVKGLRKLLFFHVRPRLLPPRTGPESRTGRFKDFRPDFYEQNLRSILSEIERAGSAPVLVTLPTVLRADMDASALRAAGVVFPYFPSAYGVGDFLDLIGAYNASIRGIGAERGVALIDLSRVFERLETTTGYFWDTMHLSPPGMRLAAAEMVVGLQQAGLLGSHTAAAGESSR